MSGFAALMALSASQTKASQTLVESALQQRKRNEEHRLRQQEAHERKQRELEQKIRLRHFEDQKKEQERQRRLGQEAQDRERLRQRREEQQREALRYGPKKAKSVAVADEEDRAGSRRAPTSRGDSQPRHRDEDRDGGDHTSSLTREEKRQRKLLSGLNARPRGASSGVRRRSKHASASSRAKVLPGGAVDITVSPGAAVLPDAGTQYRSVKERIAAQPNVLTKLNIVKRDTRTIDEILQDRARAREAKVLNGEDAKEFNDWFGKGRKTDRTKQVTTTSTSNPSSGTDTPPSTYASPSKSSNTPSIVTTTASLHSTRASSVSRHPASSINTVAVTKSSTTVTKSSVPNGSTSTSAARPKSTLGTSAVNGSSLKKRPRSPSLSDSPPPPVKRRASPANSPDDIRAEIWKMFGKDRAKYMQRDLFSDDEDMEVGASIVAQEEVISSRLAIKEDLQALEEERRHEEEKRRRKRERERRA